MLEDLHIGAPVTGADGRRLGSLTRIVVAQERHEVTHLVVDPGLRESGNLLTAGGWDKPRERIVPISLLKGAAEDGVLLASSEEELEQYPLFAHETFADAPAPSSRRFRLGELIRYIASAAGVGAAPYEPPDEEVQFNEPPGSAEIAEGTTVWRVEPHDEIGEVEQVLLDEDSGRLSGLVVRRKGVARGTVVLPAEAITSLSDGVVHVALTDDELDALEDRTPRH